MAREGNGEILSLREAANYLGISIRTLYMLSAKGEVPGIKLGGQWRFHRSSLEALFRQTASHQAPAPTAVGGAG